MKIEGEALLLKAKNFARNKLADEDSTILAIFAKGNFMNDDVVAATK